MIVVHHLDGSRSQRVLWLSEELGLPYEIEQHRRDPVTRLAPPELRRIHSLGKSPVIEEGGRVVAESGAIMDYILRYHGGGRLQPAPFTLTTTVSSIGCTTQKARRCRRLSFGSTSPAWARPPRPRASSRHGDCATSGIHRRPAGRALVHSW